jgi:hypothetical protein
VAHADMTAGFARLTGPVTLAGRVAQSRVVFGPHETNLGQPRVGEGRAFSPRHVAYYQRRAAGGAGLIVTETASVHPSDSRCCITPPGTGRGWPATGWRARSRPGPPTSCGARCAVLARIARRSRYTGWVIAWPRAGPTLR